MIVAIIFLSIVLVASLWFNVYLVRKNLALSDQREELVDQIEQSLDMLDECHRRLSHNSEIPVLSDEPIIKEVIGDVRRAKNAVLAIAAKVVVYGQDKDSDDE